ncbi:STAS domain-containing protein [Conexibacter sp. CPCC 206217]|uniref:STAS domain-containing protein n=1 Tax=Conexibacter sp. CPCC 206217 TaxID=3064574 RepID=UPI00271A054A|nr:STAS domain-containing protein [Conexibacter sp. CPCC 206217]MDO8212163.1 STAS domain-containing protein [Conexibacter sp. CPCC 206217]
MTPLARIDTEHDDEHPLVAIEGEIDASNTVEIGEALRAAVSNRSTTLVVDLTEVGYVDSAGVNLLFALGAELRDRQQRLHLVVEPGTSIARVFEIAGLTGAERTHPTRTDALADARGTPA